MVLSALALLKLHPKRLWLAGAVLAAIVGGCVQVDAWQRQVIFSPESEQPSWWRTPPEGTEIFDLPVSRGEHVRAWYWQAPQHDAPAVLYLHGARWSLNGSVFRLDGWRRMGYSILAIDYRGFGDSSPRLPSQQSATQDAKAALRELARRQPDPARRFVYGHSLGGAIAIDLATQSARPAFAGLIVESTFTSVADMLKQRGGWGSLPGASLLVTQPFDSVDKVATLALPVLFLHGTADHVVPHEMSDVLLAAAVRAPEGLRRLVKIPGASHSGAVRSGTPYRDAVQEFVRDASRAYAGEALAGGEPV